MRRLISRKLYNRLLRVRCKVALGTSLANANKRRRRKAKKDFTSLLPNEVMFGILEKLNAKDFASAACVKRSWKTLCNGVFSRPKIKSFSSYELTTPMAYSLDMILSEPIRPQFVVGALSVFGSIEIEHDSAIRYVGPHTPVITTECMAVFGEEEVNDFCKKQPMATIASFPKLMVDAIGLFGKQNTPSLEKFATDIRSFSADPILIVLFVRSAHDVLEKSHTDTLRVAQWMSKEFPNTRFICGSTLQVNFQSRGDYEFHFQKEHKGPYKKSSTSRVSISQARYEYGAALVFANNGDLLADIEIGPGPGIMQEGLVFLLSEDGAVVRVEMNMQDGSRHVMMVGKLEFSEAGDDFFIDA